MENKYQKIFKGRFTFLRTELARALNSLDAGVFASQLMAWEGKGRDPDGFIYKSAKDIKEELVLGYKRFKTAIKICKEAGILETTLKVPEFGKGPVMHFRLIDSGLRKLEKKHNSKNKSKVGKDKNVIPYID